MLGLIKRMLDPNDRSIELHDVAGLGSLVSHVALQGYATYHSHIFDAQNFGIGAGTLIGAIKAAGWMAAKVRATDAAIPGDKP